MVHRGHKLPKLLFVVCFLAAFTILLYLSTKEVTRTYGIPVVTFSIDQEEGFIDVYSTVTKNLTLGNGEVISYQVYPNMKRPNEARFISNQCVDNPEESSPSANSNGSNKKFTLVTDFLFLQHRDKQNLFVGNDGNLTDEVFIARDMEIVHTLDHNLHHPLIEGIHLLVKDVTTAEYLRHLWIPQSDRIVIKVVNDHVTMKEKIEYANNCLKNRLVAICHQDNLFGKGWEMIRPDILKRKKLMYAITRHTSENVTCSASKGSANCDPGYPYLGSHDVFFYHVKEQWAPEILKPLESITPNLSGMENLLIWFFKAKLGYTVLNPCQILFVHHHHCIPVREKGRRRVNTAATTGYASFTDKLE